MLCGRLLTAIRPYTQPRRSPAGDPSRTQEAPGIGAVDQPVVEAEREVAHRPDRDHVVDDDGALLDRADAENRDLRLADDRQPEERAEDARDS